MLTLYFLTRYSRQSSASGLSRKGDRSLRNEWICAFSSLSSLGSKVSRSTPRALRENRDDLYEVKRLFRPMSSMRPGVRRMQTRNDEMGNEIEKSQDSMGREREVMELWCQTVSVAGGGFESWVEEERRRHTVLGPVQ